jgi:hypothetical protein
MTTRLAHMPEAPTPHDQPMLTASFGPCNAAHRRGLCDLKSAIKLGFGKIPQESIGPERDWFAMRKLRARSETLNSLHDHIPISCAWLAAGFSPWIREHGIGLKQVRGDDPVETSDRIESRQDGFSQLALA